VRKCPLRGQPHKVCGRCPIYMGDGEDADGKRINQRSLKTRDPEDAWEVLTKLEKGAPLETIGHLPKIFRKHERECRRWGRGGINYFDCECTVWMHVYKGGDSKRTSISCTFSFVYQRLATRPGSPVGCVAMGMPLETIKRLGRLFRQHLIRCPHFGKLGISYLDCECPIRVDSLSNRTCGVTGRVWIIHVSQAQDASHVPQVAGRIRRVGRLLRARRGSHRLEFGGEERQERSAAKRAVHVPPTSHRAGTRSNQVTGREQDERRINHIAADDIW